MKVRMQELLFAGVWLVGVARAGLLGAGKGEGSCAAPPFRSVERPGNAVMLQVTYWSICRKRSVIEIL